MNKDETIRSWKNECDVLMEALCMTPVKGKRIDHIIVAAELVRLQRCIIDMLEMEDK